MRYTYTKYIKSTGDVIEGRANTKELAKARFKKALKAFRMHSDAGLQQTNTTNKSGDAKVLIRKKLVGWKMDQDEKGEK